MHNVDDCEVRPDIMWLRRWRERYPTNDEWWSLLQNGYRSSTVTIHNVLGRIGGVGAVL